MTRKIVVHPPKDAAGAYLPVAPPAPSAPDPELSIDELMKKGLLAIQRTLKAVLEDTSTGNPSRTSIMNLKDCMSMLESLKTREDDLLEHLDDDDLAAIANSGDK